MTTMRDVAKSLDKIAPVAMKTLERLMVEGPPAIQLQAALVIRKVAEQTSQKPFCPETCPGRAEAQREALRLLPTTLQVISRDTCPRCGARVGHPGKVFCSPECRAHYANEQENVEALELELLQVRGLGENV